MPSKTISNPGGLYGLTADPDPEFKEVVNNSGGSLLPGDVVCVAADLTGVLVTTSTTVNDKTVFGVVAAKIPSNSLSTAPTTDTYASGAVMPVIIRGPARINIAANAVVAGDSLCQSAVAKVAQTSALAPVANVGIGTIIGVALEATAAKDTNNTIRAYINKM